MMKIINLRFAFILLCAVSMACISCSWWGDDVDHDVVMQNALEAGEMEKQSGPAPSQISVLYFNGMDKFQLRTISSTVPAIDFYKVTASLDGTVVSLGNVAASSFSLNLYRTGIWNILVEGYSGTPATSTLVARGTGTVKVGSAPIYGGSASVIITPPITSGGSGQVDLKFKIPSNSSIFSQDAQVYLGLRNVATNSIYEGNQLYLKSALESGLSVEFITGTPTAAKIQLKDGNGTPVTSIPSGEYEAEFKIYQNAAYGKNYYRHVEKLYVWDGCTTNTFFDMVNGSSDEFNVDFSGTSSSANPVSIRVQEGDKSITVFIGNNQSVKKVVSSENGIKLFAYINAGQSITVTCNGQDVPIASVVGNSIGYDLPDGSASAKVEIVSSNGTGIFSKDIYYGSVYVDGDSVADGLGGPNNPFKTFYKALDCVKYTGDASNPKNTLIEPVAFNLKGVFTGADESIEVSELNGKTLKFLPWNQSGFTLSKVIKFQNCSPIMYFASMTMETNALVSLCSGSVTHLTGPITYKATSSSPSFFVDSGACIYLDSGFNLSVPTGNMPLALSLVADKSVLDPGKVMVSSALPSFEGGNKIVIDLKQSSLGAAATISDNVGTAVLHAASPYLLTQADCDFFSFSGTGGGNYFIALSSDRKTGVIRDRRATFVITQFPSQKVKLYNGASEVTDFSNMAKDKTYTLRAVVGGVENQDVTVNYHVYQGGTAGPGGSGTINFGALGLPPDKYTLYMTYIYNGTTYSENMNFTLK